MVSASVVMLMELLFNMNLLQTPIVIRAMVKNTVVDSETQYSVIISGQNQPHNHHPQQTQQSQQSQNQITATLAAMLMITPEILSTTKNIMKNLHKGNVAYYVLTSNSLPCRPVVSVAVVMPMELLNSTLKLLTRNVVKICLVEGGGMQYLVTISTQHHQ
jgi:hypothetical protein